MKLKPGQRAFKCPRCGEDLIYGKKRAPSYTCHKCKQQMFITTERLDNPELLRKSLDVFRDNANTNYKVMIKNQAYDNNRKRPNNFISK